MLWQSRLLLGLELSFDYLSGFVFLATLFLYAAHRIVGISRLKEFLDVSRYHVIASFKWHIFTYALLAGLGSLYCFLQLTVTLQWALIIPSLFSLAYVIPILGKKKRLRDVNHLKIYLIAIIWAFVTVSLPAIDSQQASTLPTVLMFLERALFIFVITIPFDIRDLKVDNYNAVMTLPAKIGLKKAIQLGYILLSFFLALAFINFYLGTYSIPDVLALSFSAIFTAIFLSRSHPDQHDYFYSGMMDGTMILQFLLVWVARHILV